MKWTRAQPSCDNYPGANSNQVENTILCLIVSFILFCFLHSQIYPNLLNPNQGCQSVDKGGGIWIFCFRRLAWFVKVDKITFFGVYSKMAEKRIFSIFFYSDLNLCKASQVHAFSPHACASLHGSLWKFGWWSIIILWT